MGTQGLCPTMIIPLQGQQRELEELGYYERVLEVLSRPSWFLGKACPPGDTI
jgi:hypothetical protein